ncbi:MAG: T9SS type A sorting domain-containing protein [Bacteroidetes bacterium]|nr:T9SS type A sorting domain-containing protein [Bacteroidota bacterium]
MRFTIFSFLIFLAAGLSANNSDTFKIRSHNSVLIQTNPAIGHTEYSEWAVFPSAGKSWSKMYIELTMKCPPGMTCGEWDYLNYIFIGKRHGKTKDTLNWEIARFITAYGLQFNNTWKHTWRFDITDFASLFHDSIEIWHQHTGYEAKNGRGWLIDIDFTMIEGPVSKRVVNVQQILRKSVGYGNDSLFDARMNEDTFKVGNFTTSVRYKILQTGHGNDGKDGCGEFCAKKRYIQFDGKTIDTSLVWRDDCGANAVYPQAGTWIYDRANWCPGADVKEYNLDIPVDPGSVHRLDMDMESYSGGGNYMTTLYLLELADANFSTDASLEEIIKPSDELQYLRINPSCGAPLIKIRNNGADVLHDLHLEYGWKGYQLNRFHWTGNLKYNQTAEVELPALSGEAPAGTPFVVHIIWTNNRQDQNANNDRIQSIPMLKVPQHNGNFVVILRTNNAATENYYTLKKADGTLIKQRGNLVNNTLYRDTFNLPDGCYFLNLMDDGVPPPAYALNEDGLGWWANNYDGTGLFQLRNGSGNTLIKNFPVDFGTGIWYQFQVGPGAISQAAQANLRVYPNPAENTLLIDLGANSTETLNIKMYNTVGKKVIDESRSGNLDALQYLELCKLSPGIYTISIQIGAQNLTQKIIKR